MDRPAFSIALMQELLRSMPNWYGSDNWDSEVFGSYKSSFKSLLLTKFNESFSRRKFTIFPKHIDAQIQKISSIESSLADLSSVYDLLEDEPSKSTLVKLISYRIMGNNKVKLPVNTDSYWSQRKSPRSLISSKDTIKIKFNDWVLEHFALEKVGYPIELYTVSGGVHIIFMLRQYEYGKRRPAIKAQAGDYVIDAGGGWGDTALYFAHEVGPLGKVYTFEFAPDNLEVLNRNINLNVEFSKRIKVLQKALWNESGKEIVYSAHGPATTLNNNKEGPLHVMTLSLDDFVKEEKLPRVDYIKMDIEGAELGALRGAEETIRAFKPKLAISAYHKPNDLTVIPRYLNGLGLGYEFFLDHFTVYEGETVLFANPKN